MYLDQGYDVAKDFLHKNLTPLLEGIIKEGSDRDPKSSLQERAQEKAGETPRYEVVTSTGPDHAKHFTVAVFIGDNKVAEGDGASKQQAEQSAADAALAVWPG